jgi:hypothetical protein
LAKPTSTTSCSGGRDASLGGGIDDRLGERVRRSAAAASLSNSYSPNPELHGCNLHDPDATMHASERMVRQIYDRRRVRTAKPAR